MHRKTADKMCGNLDAGKFKHVILRLERSIESTEEIAAANPPLQIWTIRLN